jgi:crossover junction endodeoxyribonuclease RusA
MNIELYLPWPPSVNNYYVKTKRGMFISAKGRKFRDQTAEAINSQVPGLAIPSDDRLLFEVVLFPPDARIRDVDNYSKSLLDAIVQTGLLPDDKQIDQLFIYRGQRVMNGSVFCRIAEAGPVVPAGKRP